MILSEKQKSIINQAIELLIPLAQAEEERLSRNTVYFKVKNEEVSSEYDTCDDEKCIKESKKEIRKSYGKGIHIEENWSDNDGDHENIERCSICGRPLSNSLTWIEQELDHHEKNTITIEDLQDGCSAFDVKIMLEAMPTCDHCISEYDLHQERIGNPKPLEQAKKRQEEFINRVINYAELVISKFKN